MTTNEKNKSQWVTIGIAVIIALLAINAWLFYDRYQSKKEIATLSTDLDESETLARDLEKQYYETLSQLEEMRGDNAEMNTLIETQKEELRLQKDEISKLIKTSKDYNNIKQKMRALEDQSNTYLAELDALREQNLLLTEANQQLSVEKQDLEQSLDVQVRENEDLTTTKTQLTAEKARLEGQNTALATKVNQASVISIPTIEVTGYKVSDSGKESKKRYANNIDRLKVCLDSEANPVAEPGTEEFYVRIISPIGQTITTDDGGDGLLTTADGDQVKYSFMKEVDYNQTTMQTCVNWEPGANFDKGIYKVEVFNKGHLAGVGTFKLR